MPEIRRDPVTGRWVIIATERAARPHDFVQPRGRRAEEFCPFCEGNEDRTPPEVLAVRPEGSEPNGPGWQVRVVPNKFPALKADGEFAIYGKGLFQSVEGYGFHEVVIESPRHVMSPAEMDAEHVALVLKTCRNRMSTLGDDQRIAYVLLFKNVGLEAGASIAHSHSQIMAMPVMPKRVHEEIRTCEATLREEGKCIFCQIVRSELQAGERVVLASENFLVLSPYAARFPFEMWLVPRYHEPHFHLSGDDRLDEFAAVLKDAVERLDRCLSEPPYNYALHTAPVGGMRVDCYHWHLELIPRVTRLAGFEWGTGFYINPMEPERAAEYLRQARQGAQVAEGIVVGAPTDLKCCADEGKR